VDPNTADWQTLAVMPAIGEKRAKEIVAYRERKRAETPNGVVFDAPGDLLYVRGIGPALVEAMKPYLTFPTTAPSTRPATAPSPTTRQPS
jgi:DNA uptake protein ComE-like DNA-binding protein